MTVARLTIVSAAWGLLVYIGLLALAAYRAGGFDYPLDDVYIHLSMAEQIAAGGYGINPGEYASAASSMLYPLLLLPFQATELNRLLPMVWNMAAVLAAGLLMARILVQTGQAAANRFALAVAVLMPLGVYTTGAAFTGMENSLHAAVTLGLASGLITFASTGRIGVLLILGVLIGPLLRFEALAPSLVAAGIVFLSRPWAGIALAVGAIAPLAGFAGWLQTLGLGALPNSVMAKLAEVEPLQVSRLDKMISVARGNLALPAGQAAAVLGLFWLALSPFLASNMARLLALGLVAVAAAHLLVGKVRIEARYETYMLAWMLALSLYLCSQLPSLLRIVARGAILVWLVTLALTYQTVFGDRGQYATQAIHLQQGQMARLVHDHLKVPTAVNDIGYVSYQSPVYILDLLGLGNREALLTRAQGGQNWAEPLVAFHQVQAAMIYSDWLPRAAGPNWVELGTLGLTTPGGYLGGRVVTIYATDPRYVDTVTAALETFIPTLPEGAVFTPTEEREQ